VPDQEAGVGRGDQQRVVDAAHLACQRAGEHGADDQAEAPVDPGTGQRDERDQHDGLARGLRDAGHAVEQSVDCRRPCQGMAGDQDQRHLHGEGQQVPEAVAPVLRHGRQALTGAEHGGDQHDQREQDGEDEGRGEEALHQVDAGGGYSVEHDGVLPCCRYVAAQVRRFAYECGGGRLFPLRCA